MSLKCFRVKFYVTDPSRLQEEYTRYHVYLQVKNPTQIQPGEKFPNVMSQVKRDLATGRLIAPISTVCLLASYAVQSTLGDHDPDSCRSGYLEPFQVKHPTISSFFTCPK